MTKFYESYIINNPTEPRDKFAFIIGAEPSKGARSPILWNSTYEKFKLAVRMIPFDVRHGGLNDLLEALNSDERCIGGAITAPFKEQLFQTSASEKFGNEIMQLGAANCLHRKNTGGAFDAKNTDVSAAVECLKSIVGPLQKKNIIIFGFGGVGKPLAIALDKIGASVCVSKRNHSLSEIKTYPKLNFVEWGEKLDKLSNQDIVINATDIGFGNSGKETQSPLSEDEILQLHPDVLVYDIVYSDAPTVLQRQIKKMGAPFLNGSSMNLAQAVLAFKCCNSTLKQSQLDSVETIMHETKIKNGW